MNGKDKLKLQRSVSFQTDVEISRETEEEYEEETREKEAEEDNIPVIQREGATTTERKADLENAMSWLRKELQEMQSQDKDLTRQLIGLRSKIKTMMKAVGDDIVDSDTAESIDSGISTM